MLMDGHVEGGRTRERERGAGIGGDGSGRVPNVDIPETETIKFVRTYQEKRRRQLIKTNDGHGRTGEEKKGGG